MRTSLTTCEMILVRALDCNLEIELPFAHCLNVLRAMGAVSFYKDTKKQSHHMQKDVWKQMEQSKKERKRKKRGKNAAHAFFS